MWTDTTLELTRLLYLSLLQKTLEGLFFPSLLAIKLIDGVVPHWGHKAFHHTTIITVAIGLLNQSSVLFHYFGYIILWLL